MVNTIVIGVFAVWWVLTAVYATPLRDRLPWRAPLLARFVPQWNFFAPSPGVHDFHLLYRDKFSNGAVGVWQEVPPFTAHRHWMSAIWNPEKRIKKALYDLTLTIALSKPVAQVDAAWIKLSVPYLLLANYVSSLDRPFSVSATQFLLMQSSPGDAPAVLFVSDLHSL